MTAPRVPLDDPHDRVELTSVTALGHRDTTMPLRPTPRSAATGASAPAAPTANPGIQPGRHERAEEATPVSAEGADPATTRPQRSQPEPDASMRSVLPIPVIRRGDVGGSDGDGRRDRMVVQRRRPPAFWVVTPGPRRDPVAPTCRISRPGRGARAGRRTPGSAAAPRRSSSAAGSRRAVRRDAGAVPGGGDLPGPVKYGYLNVGVVEAGAGALVGRTVFCLHPHQTAYVVPATRRDRRTRRRAARRAVLAGTVETAVNALWDAAPLVGDRVAVVGAGMVGCCVARLLARIPGVRGDRSSTSTPARADVAAALGVGFAPPGRRARRPRPRRARQRHRRRPAALPRPARRRRARSSTSAGTATPPVTAALGGAFHSARLAIRASQVGAVAAARRGRRTTADRLALALSCSRPGVRRAAHRRVPRSPTCPDLMAAARRGRPARALSHDHLRRRGSAMFR